VKGYIAMQFLSWNNRFYPADKITIDGYKFSLNTVSQMLESGTITRYSSRGGYLNFHTSGNEGKVIK
jgi:hypothetical protein